LPPEIVAGEIEDVRRRGVTISLDSPVGPAGTAVADLMSEHGALFLAVGAQRSVGLPLEGAEALSDFQTVLRRANLGMPLDLGRKVAVVGGGEAALDVCRTALRQGAEEVHLLYRRTREHMPARDEDVEECLREGVKFHFLAAPTRILQEDGRLRGLAVQRMKLGAPDAGGRPRPEPEPGSVWLLEVDSAVAAVGQAVGGGVLGDPYLSELRLEADGRVWVDTESQRTSVPRIYAGGDVVTGPATAVEALSQGRRAAMAIWGDLDPKSWNQGRRLRDRRIRKPFSGHLETPEAKIRARMPRLPLDVRHADFREVEQGLPDEAACREAGRCLQCHREL
jgi:NADPH-dependent glutamate synthase beta subunit-like oxidoreductase